MTLVHHVLGFWMCKIYIKYVVIYKYKTIKQSISYIFGLGVYLLPFEWPCKIPEVYKAPRLWRCVYYREKNSVPAVTRMSAIHVFKKKWILFCITLKKSDVRQFLYKLYLIYELCFNFRFCFFENQLYYCWKSATPF